jgi:hypothetical protein
MLLRPRDEHADGERLGEATVSALVYDHRLN